MAIDWTKVFDNFGIKTVTKTDKRKGAYVPTTQQRTAIKAAAIKPATARPAPEFNIIVLFDGTRNAVKASYYHSMRSNEAERSPEPRMGHEFISSWLQEGDRVLIGNLGNQVFALRLRSAPALEDDIVKEVSHKADPRNVLRRAKAAKGKPARRIVQRNDFVRDPYVVQGALLRSNGKCEMPGCTRGLFPKDDNRPYLEVHHVTPLSEHGADTLVNAAALCPHCHRSLHFGKNRMANRKILASHIAKLPV